MSEEGELSCDDDADGDKNNSASKPFKPGTKGNDQGKGYQKVL